MSPISWQKRSDMRYIDHDVPRVDGPLKVTGQAQYTHDVRLPDMLWARVLLAPRPVVHPILDLEAARKVPGVELVMSLEEQFPLREGWTRRLGQPLFALFGFVAGALTPFAGELLHVFHTGFESAAPSLRWLFAAAATPSRRQTVTTSSSPARSTTASLSATAATPS